jgi:hypothetical protein
MKTRKWWLILCVVAPVCFLMGADQVTFKTVRARDAKVAYDDAIKKAELDYNQKVFLATKNYRARLEAAKGAVLAEGNLDEIRGLQAELDRLDQELKDYKDTRPVPSRGLIIGKAQYGLGDKWADVTELVRSRQNRDAVNNVPNLPDPAWGKHKTLIVHGMYGGKEFVLSFNTRGPGETLVFGAPSEDLKIVRE